MKSKKSMDSMEIDSNTNIISPEQLKKNLLNINNSLCNYIKSLNQNFDESPELLNDTSKYSDQLINEFTNFYNQFNLLTEEALKDNNNQKQKNSSLNPKSIVIDNKMVKSFSESIGKNLFILDKKNKETDIAIKNYERELNELKEYIKSKDKKV